jgi:uncharacterized integral membrane protein (TIGR00697 family)
MNELLWVATLLLNFAAIIICYRLFGKTGLFVWIPISVIVANIQVVKTVELFTLSATLGNIVYATSFLATDILSENYGKKEAKRAVYIGFFSLIVMAAFMNLALLFRPAPEDFAQSSLVTIFNLIPRIAGASLLAYWISQLHDVWAYQFWKKRFPSLKFIWLRNNASTIVSQLIDSVIFTLVAFAGKFPAKVLLEIVISTYLLKVIVAAADTPFIYIARWMMKRNKLP